MRRAISVWLSAAFIGLTPPVIAQDLGQDQAQNQPQGQEQSRDAVLLADSVRMQGRNVLVAEGSVEAFYQNRVVRASRLTYDRTTETLTIEGPIVLTGGDDTIVLADAAELDPGFENGLLLGARMILNQQVQLAANQINRVGGRYSELYKVAATSCRVCDSSTPPIWQIRASKTTHDMVEQQLYFENAQLRVLDVPILWLPRLRLPDPSLARADGFLIPELQQTSQLGLGIKIPYFLTLGDHRDLTFTPYFSANTRTLELRYRQAFHNGRLSFEGAISDDDIDPTRWRGYLFGTGSFALQNGFNLDLQVEASTDNAYLLDYDYSSKDRLESVAALTKVTKQEYRRAAITSYQTLRDSENNSTLPTIILDYEEEQRLDPGRLGGILTFDFEAHSHYRYSNLDIAGRDATRVHTGLRWDRDFLLPGGIQARYHAGLSADGFVIAQDSTSASEAGEITPETSLSLRWPWMKTAASGATYVVEPVAMIGWVGGDSANIPNEESTQVEVDESSLLDLSHFPAYDRKERGVVGAAGLNWTRFGPMGGSQSFAIGQIYRAEAVQDFSVTSGLSGKSSDLIIAGQAKTGTGLTVMARTQLETDALDVTKAEARVNWTYASGDLGASYIWLGADAAEGRPNTISEWLFDAEYRLNRHWTTAVDWRYDVVTNKTAEAGMDLTYRNECVQMRLSLSRRFTSSTIVEPSTTLGFFVNLLGFNAGANDSSYTRTCRN